MNVKQIDQIVEVLFQGGPGDFEGGSEPLNKRFSWKDPVTGKSPPKPPKAMLPGKADFDALETPPAAPQAAPTPSAPSAPDDRTGSVSMNQMLPPNEMATIDQLLDRYLQMQKTHGPEAAKAWFDQYRTAEFESALQKMVNALLG